MHNDAVEPDQKVNLLLSYAWLPLAVCTARACFHHFMRDRVLGVDRNRNVFTYAEWQRGLRKQDEDLDEDAVPVELDPHNPYMRSAGDRRWMLPTVTIATERFFLTPRKRRQKLRKIDYCRIHRWTCQFCWNRFGYDDLSVDHLIPRSEGGPSIPENLTLMCKSCNQRKAARDVRHDAHGVPLSGTPVPERYLVVDDADRRPEWDELLWS